MDAATIEETNRIRISLGMKPLPVPGATAQHQESDSESDGEKASTLESRQAQAYDNYNKVMEAEAAKKKREERAAAVRKARDKAQRFAVIEGKGLGEEEARDVDAKSWLMGQKKRQKKIDKARKLEEELAAAEAAAAAQVQYTSKDLAGIKVAHDSSAFLDGDEQILTLKDTTIGENEEEGDELENLDMRDAEKLNDRLDVKNKRPGYNPNDDDEDGGILAQYDEEISGKRKKNFTLDSKGVIAELSDILEQPAMNQRQKQTVSLDDVVGDGPTSNDYLDISEIKVKKPKKKKKGTRRKQEDEDDIFPAESTAVGNPAMDVDTTGPPQVRKRKSDDAFVDDEDLQAQLAMQRKAALKKRKRQRPEDLAKQLKEQEQESEKENGTVKESSDGLVMGEISEFVAGLRKPEDEEERKVRRRKTTTRTPEPDDDHHMSDGGDDADTFQKEGTSSRHVPEEPMREDEEEEKAVGASIGAALALLRERGLVEKSESATQFKSFRERADFLARKRNLEDELDVETRTQRERDRASGKLDRMSLREREEHSQRQNTWRDHQQSRRMAELFSEGYKPNVELKYTDEHGRSLDQKEAFKHLSHQFHGKGSGKGKTEKMMKKVEEEKRREAQSMFDASQEGMTRAAQQQVKKRREAGVRLG